MTETTTDKSELAKTPTPAQDAGVDVAEPLDLVSRVKAYDKHADEALLALAYDYAVKKHGTQLRASGDPYFMHPVEVATILTDLKLDTAAIITGLLHDTVEDTDATKEEITRLFGAEIADLVEGVTKLTRLELDSERTKQAENLRKFILAVSQDVRVLLVKLADRLHNMRTLDFLQSKEKRERIALETLEIYSPLARSIGVDGFAVELEDLSFKHLNPSAYTTISKRLEDMQASHGDIVEHITQEITQLLGKHGLQASVYGRVKRPYSIWQKLQRKSISFNQIADIYAFRILVEHVSDCYQVMGVIHQTWPCMPDRFRDFISTPKANNYRSLHTTVLGPRATRIEVQIRTFEMEELNENGVAAHWRYKDENYGFDSAAAKAAGTDPLLAVRSLLQILEHGGDVDDFLEHAKLEMFQDQVFAFTPKGEVITLPKGATPLDFAYAVHTNVGDRCIAAKINNELKPLRTVLQNGDQVEIITGDRAEVPADWTSLVVSGRAKAAIKRRIKQTEKDEFVRLGRTAAEQAFTRIGYHLKDVSLRDGLVRLEIEDEEELFDMMGKGRVTARDLIEAVFPGMKDGARMAGARQRITSGPEAWLYVRGGGMTPGVSIHMAKCCTPMPGDRIVGIMEPGKGVMVHAIDCAKLVEQDEGDEAWLDLQWTPEAERNTTSIGRVLTTMRNAPGVMGQVCAIVGENNGNIVNLSLTQRQQDFFVVSFDIEVVDSKHLTNISAALRACPEVETVERPRGEEQDL